MDNSVHRPKPKQLLGFRPRKEIQRSADITRASLGFFVALFLAEALNTTHED
jgi:hypothetical protein